MGVALTEDLMKSFIASLAVCLALMVIPARAGPVCQSGLAPEYVDTWNPMAMFSGFSVSLNGVVVTVDALAIWEGEKAKLVWTVKNQTGQDIVFGPFFEVWGPTGGDDKWDWAMPVGGWFSDCKLGLGKGKSCTFSQAVYTDVHDNGNDSGITPYTFKFSYSKGGGKYIDVASPATVTVSDTPEPSTILLFGSGIFGLAAGVRRRLY